MFRNYTCLFFILFLTQVISQERDSNNYTYNGNKFSEKKVFDEAEMSYRKAISSEPNNLKALYNLGNTHYKEKDFDEAAQRFFQTQKETDNKYQKHKAFHNMGNVYMQQKEYAKAIEAYKNALRNDSTDDKTRYNYALAKELLEKEKQKQKDKESKEDQKQEEEKKNDQENDDKKDDGNSQNQDKEEKDGKKSKNEGDDNKKDKNPKKNQDSDSKKDSPKPKGRLSNQQMKNLLEAMNNQEKKVQDKVNAKKIKGVPVRGKKDW